MCTQTSGVRNVSTLVTSRSATPKGIWSHINRPYYWGASINAFVLSVHTIYLSLYWLSLSPRRHWILQALCTIHQFNFRSPLILHLGGGGAGTYPSYLRVEAGYTLDCWFIAGPIQRGKQPSMPTDNLESEWYLCLWTKRILGEYFWTYVENKSCQGWELWECISLSISSTLLRWISACLKLEPCANYQTSVSVINPFCVFICIVKLSKLNLCQKVENEIMNVSFSPFIYCLCWVVRNTGVVSRCRVYWVHSRWSLMQNTQRTVSTEWQSP